MRVALVLGAAVWPDGTASPTLALRVEHAVTLWREGRVDAICVAGWKGAHGAPEGRVGCDLAARLGVPRDRLIAETESRSTVENLSLAVPLLVGHELVVISSRWHLPRVWLAARIMGLRVALSGPRGRMTWSRTARAALREAAALPSTAMRARAAARRR